MGGVLAISPSAVMSAAAEELPQMLQSTGRALSKMGSFIGGRLMDTVDQLSSRNLQSVTSLTQVFTSAGETPSPADVQVFAANQGESGDFSYTVLDDGMAEVVLYNGSATNLAIPSELDGYRVTSIGRNVFETCVFLVSIEIPDSVTNIDNSMLVGCPVETITVDDRNPVYADIDGVLFNKDLTTLYRYPTGRAVM